MIFHLLIRPEFFACGNHSKACAPVCHQFIFLNISGKKQDCRLSRHPENGCHLHSHIFSVILYNLHRRYILLPMNTVKKSSLHRYPTCPPPVPSEVHPFQTARVPLSHKHESKHCVLPPDFLSFNKGNERNKMQCRVAEFTTSPTILKYDGFCAKISRKGNKKIKL